MDYICQGLAFGITFFCVIFLILVLYAEIQERKYLRKRREQARLQGIIVDQDGFPLFHQD